MAVGLWAVLGVVLLLLGLPLAFFAPVGGYAVGAGVAFLIVALVEWWIARPEHDPLPPELEAAPRP